MTDIATGSLKVIEAFLNSRLGGISQTVWRDIGPFLSSIVTFDSDARKTTFDKLKADIEAMEPIVDEIGKKIKKQTMAGRMAAVDDRCAAWAQAVGVPWGPLDVLVKQDHLHELDAVVAHLYGLTERQLVHLFETFHEGCQYADGLTATLNHFNDWEKKVKG